LEAAKDGYERLLVFGLWVASGRRQLNTKDNDGQTVLHAASRTCCAAVCRLLV